MVIVNRMALVAWGFALVFLLMVGIFTAILVRSGPPPGYSATVASGFLAAFWLGGLGLATYASSRPYVRLEITAEGLTIATWRYPFRRVVRTVSAERVTPATVIRVQDDEGQPYFMTRALLDDGAVVDLAEGHDREACEDVCEGFNRMLSERERTNRRR